eukprot:288759-Lingulodinium_polyedra.AAC.1
MSARTARANSAHKSRPWYQENHWADLTEASRLPESTCVETPCKVFLSTPHARSVIWVPAFVRTTAPS